MHLIQAGEASGFPVFTDYEKLNAGLGVLLSQFRKKENVHAYLLTGPAGIGKRTLATVLACTLVCTSLRKPCGVCAECRKVLDGCNPDLITLFSEDGKSIGVEEVRSLIETISRHSFGGGPQIVLIEPMEKMTPQAQNCLLKSLEEPPADVVFLLMAHELRAALGTIASRCVRVKVTPWQDTILEEVLKSAGYAQADIDAVLPKCCGNIGAAVSMLRENAQDSEAQAFVRDALSMTKDAQAVALSSRLKEGKKAADTYLDALEQAIHQILLVRTGCMNPSALGFCPPVWKKVAEKAPEHEINALLSAIFETRRRKNGQVTWQNNIDQLMMAILEEQQKWQE